MSMGIRVLGLVSFSVGNTVSTALVIHLEGTAIELDRMNLARFSNFQLIVRRESRRQIDSNRLTNSFA